MNRRACGRNPGAVPHRQQYRLRNLHPLVMAAVVAENVLYRWELVVRSWVLDPYPHKESVGLKSAVLSLEVAYWPGHQVVG